MARAAVLQWPMIIQRVSDFHILSGPGALGQNKVKGVERENRVKFINQ